MSESAVYRPHPEDPAKVTLFAESATGPWEKTLAHRFDLVSRGDFVQGILYRRIRREGPKDLSENGDPLLIIQHSAAGHRHTPDLACAAAWVDKGFAVASIDLPLHGSRSSPKLSARLVSGIRQLATGAEIDSETRVLVEEFARQSTSDLIRTLDALSELPGIDGNRIGFMGMGVGAIAGAYLLAHDPRPLAIVLAMAGGGRGGEDLDPVTYLEHAKSESLPNAKRSILIVAQEDHPRVSRADVDALYEAAPEPKQRIEFRGAGKTLPVEVLHKIEAFFVRQLKS